MADVGRITGSLFRVQGFRVLKGTPCSSQGSRLSHIVVGRGILPELDALRVEGSGFRVHLARPKAAGSAILWWGQGCCRSWMH